MTQEKPFSKQNKRNTTTTNNNNYNNNKNLENVFSVDALGIGFA